MEKLLVLATLGRKAYSKWLFQRMLTRAIVVVGIIFIIAILLSALLIGVLFTIHAAFLQGGFSPPVAMLMIGIITLCIIGMLVMLAQHFARQLPRMLAPQSPITARISDTIHSFMDGFMEK
jgi:protein-S-isoprenylcysteine O-methyltransferase Ste14